MTVTSQTTDVTVNGNDVATVFSFSPLAIYATDELLVIKVSSNIETVLTEGVGATNYSVQLSNPPATGTITYPASGGTPLATGDDIIIKRVMTLEQQTNLENQGGYFPDVQEDEFDRQMMVDLQQQEEIDRSPKVPLSETAVSLEIPNITDRASKFWKWNADGTVAAATGTGAGNAWSDAVDSDILPDTDSTRDIGATANRFAEIWSDLSTTSVLSFGPKGTQNITAASDTLSATASVLAVTPDADYVLTSTPSIAAPASSGDQILIIHNVSSTFTIDLQDDSILVGSSIVLGSSSGTIKQDGVMTLLYAASSGTWWVLSNPNTASVGASASTLQVRNASGSSIAAGKSVYITGYNIGQGRPTIDVTDANVAAEMPAIGITPSAIANGANGEVVAFGTVTSAVDTSSASVGDGVWIDDTVPGDVVFTRPSVDNIQKIGVVARSHASLGVVVVNGAGRINDTPIDISVGDITVSGTVDGRDVATDGTKLDGIEAAATADQTDEEIEDIVGAMYTGNTETGITVTYQDGDGTVDFVTDVTSVFSRTGAVVAVAGDYDGTAIDMQDSVLTRPEIKDYSITDKAATTHTGSVAISHADGNVYIDTAVTGNLTLSVTNWPSGFGKIDVWLKSDGSGGHTITLTGFTWATDAAAAMTASKWTRFTLESTDGGTTEHAFLIAEGF